MNVLSHALAAAALMAGGVIYGTDVFCAIVQRPALARVDDRTLTSMMGRVHQYGDRRLPVPGALGVAAAALAAVTAAIAGHTAAAAAAGAAVAALVVWLVIYLRISAPVNHALTAAAASGHIPPGARSLQRRWDSVITTRAILQAVAVAALCAALALP
jgi:cellulase/cellobiase CelA1